MHAIVSPSVLTPSVYALQLPFSTINIYLTSDGMFDGRCVASPNLRQVNKLCALVCLPFEFMYVWMQANIIRACIVFVCCEKRHHHSTERRRRAYRRIVHSYIFSKQHHRLDHQNNRKKNGVFVCKRFVLRDAREIFYTIPFLCNKYIIVVLYVRLPMFNVRVLVCCACTYIRVCTIAYTRHEAPTQPSSFSRLRSSIHRNTITPRILFPPMFRLLGGSNAMMCI